MNIDQSNMTPIQDEGLVKFVSYCREKLGYTTPAKIRLYDNHETSKEMKSMAAFYPETQEIYVLRGSRVRADWYRSLAHELVHHKQREDNVPLSNEDGNETENEANSMAGVILREYGRIDPEIYSALW